MTTFGCPGCGTPEGAYHEDGCTAAGIGCRPCCRSRVFLDHFEPHLSDCPEWGVRPIRNFDYLGDPWHGLTFARGG